MKTTAYKCDQCAKVHDESPSIDGESNLITLKIPSRQSSVRNQFHFCDVSFLHLGDYIRRAGWSAHFERKPQITDWNKISAWPKS